MTAPLRIAFLVSADQRSGTYYRYHQLAAGLVARGHGVTVYSQSTTERRRASEEERDGVRYMLPACFPGNRFIEFAFNPANFLRRLAVPIGPADIFHLFQPMPNAAAVWLWLRQTRKGQALFAWDWDDLWDQDYPYPRRLERWIAVAKGRFERLLPQRAGVVTTCSTYLARLALERGAERAEVVRNGFNPPPPASDRTLLRRSFGLRENALYLAFIGWTLTEVEWCLAALRSLPPNVRLACGGADIRKAVPIEPGLAERIDFLGEFPPTRAAELMQAVDLGLLPLAPTPFNLSRLPIKLADYLAAGLRVICADVGEAGLVAREMRGAFVFPGERDAWVAGCVSVARRLLAGETVERPDLEQLRAALAWPVLAEQLEQIYRSTWRPEVAPK